MKRCKLLAEWVLDFHGMVFSHRASCGMGFGLVCGMGFHPIFYGGMGFDPVLEI